MSKAPRPKVAHPVSKEGVYEPRGTYEAFGGIDKVYITGPDEAEHAIVVVYDIFGFWETTLRGSDLLVSHLQLTLPHKVYMPDLFHGNPVPPEKDGNKEFLGNFFATTAKLDDRLPELLKFAGALKKDKGIKTVSILGYCWGGKIAMLALGDASSAFDNGATCHPAMLDNSDGEKLAKPLAFYPSKDEPEEVVIDICQAIEKKKFAEQCEFHVYDSVHHGWAAARADLDNEENRKQYDDVYQRLADYFARVNA